MHTFLIFGILNILIIVASWRSLFTIKSHGFYRFFGWEGIAWLFAVNYKAWLLNPFSLNQILSWILMTIAYYLVIAGLLLMRKLGKANKTRNEKTLFQFEQTTELIDSGIFKYIRHPLYASLIYLTWGIYLKNPDIELFLVSIISTLFLILTSLCDEKECIHYFGDKYKAYIKRSKRFIPFIIEIETS